ncbi:D-alanyl-D-alanine carboxypeptidase [Lyngbya confervoides]|uniref:D-alanyl-D-alanine carboxypeptidase n=1 Tax=Lyngbya confervoides BDU141951 TaxID=1574623 RepID=A0ABD4T6L5_9CYAN|nr:D-alanyl-D-alanine carboxypeptidase [Lyngbya confervoides]MCM1984209.1 D-alanyl-D-alanine carboxypeptidase [Lyngbya confervoides BDU141951]
MKKKIFWPLDIHLDLHFVTLQPGGLGCNRRLGQAAILGGLLLFVTACNGTQTSSSGPSIPDPPAASPSAVTTIAQFALVQPQADQAELTRRYLSSLQDQGFNSQDQGFWVQNESELLASHQGRVSLPAASITKIATTLAALEKLGPQHRFQTTLNYQGTLSSGKLLGNLVVSGGADPFFVWEDGIQLANLLETLGIREVTGNILVTPGFQMNFETDPLRSGQLLKQAMDQSQWSEEASAQYQTLPPNTPRPSLEIAGQVQVIPSPPTDTKLLVRHSSLPLIELLKRMNRYSNNPMADQIANYIGGPQMLESTVLRLTGIDPEEVSFINGSGLGEENKISARGASFMLIALANLLESQQYRLGDVITLIGLDEGILDTRPLPEHILVKSGTLDQVSALVGVIPTQQQGLIWFSMLNSQGDVDRYREHQEQMLRTIIERWGPTQPQANQLQPTRSGADFTAINEVLLPPNSQPGR